MYEQFLDDLRKSYEHPPKGSSANLTRPSSPGAALSLAGAAASSPAIPPDTYIVQPQITQRRPDPSEEASVKTSSRNKLHVQQQHHHQFGSGGAGPSAVSSAPSSSSVSVLGIDDLRASVDPNPNFNSSALASTISVLTRPSSTTTASLKLIADSRAILMGRDSKSRPKRDNLPSVFDERDPNLPSESEVVELDPFIQAIMSKLKKNSRKTRSSFASGISSLHTDDASAHSKDYSLDSAKKKILLEKIQPPPLHVMAESLATVEG